LLSSHTLLLFAVGVTLYAGFFHWALQRHLRAGRWLTAWSALATLYVSARYVQLATFDPIAVLWASRVFSAIAPALIWTMLRFVLDLTDQTPVRRTCNALRATAIGLGALILCTPWFVSDVLAPRTDLFGAHYLAARSGPAFGVVAVLVGGALAWGIAALLRATNLKRSERWVLTACLGSYALLAVSSVFSSLGLNPLPGLAEFGPLIVSIGTSHLIANRERSLESGLSSLVDEQTAALRASEERYRGLVEHAPIGVLACDQEGNVLAITARFREILGMGGSGGSTIPVNLLRDAPGRARPFLGPIERALATGRTVSGEQPYPTANGRTVDLKVVIAPHRSSAGAPKGASILIEDVTERREVEARLRQSLKLEAIGQLAAGIAQGVTSPMEDVRAHLAAMREGCDALRKQLAGSAHADETGRFGELEQLIDESCEGVERALAIVRDMRDLSQGRSLAVEPLDLNALLDGVVRMAATQRRGAVEIVERYGTLAPIAANAGQLRQVFLNLVVNAIQAVGERGRVEIETAPERDGLCVRVRDDGPGIAPEHRDRLFVPFFTTKPEKEGTGLGLFLSYQIVQGHGGEIRVRSQPGAGSTFEVWLPCEPPAPAGAA
jgi:PAS domain S-box-containing protein